MDEELESLFHQLGDAARAAIKPLFSAGFETANKGSDDWFDPVTDADRAAETAIREILKSQRPDDGIVGEEFDSQSGSSSHRWIIDPIDGTRSFLAGVPLFGTIIGLAEGDRPVAGMFDQAFTGERYLGGDAGSFLVHAGEKKQIKTGSRRSLNDAIMMTTSPAMFPKEERATYDALEMDVRLARYGADGYAYTLLASGHIDLVVESGLQTYDIAGLIPIIEGAGGVVTSWSGGSALNGGQIIAAANVELHEQALERLKPVATD